MKTKPVYVIFDLEGEGSITETESLEIAVGYLEQGFKVSQLVRDVRTDEEFIDSLFN